MYIVIVVSQHWECTIVRRTSPFIIIAVAQLRVPPCRGPRFEPVTYLRAGMGSGHDNQCATQHPHELCCTPKISYVPPQWATSRHLCNSGIGTFHILATYISVRFHNCIVKVSMSRARYQDLSLSHTGDTIYRQS